VKNHHHRLRPKIRIKQQANHRRLCQINQQHMVPGNQHLLRIKGRLGAVENNFDMINNWKETMLGEGVILQRVLPKLMSGENPYPGSGRTDGGV
jgi:hypothetical protein